MSIDAAIPALLGVVPVLIGPLQVLLVLLPAILLALLTAVISLLRPGAMLALLKTVWRLKIPLLLLLAVLLVALLLLQKLSEPRPGEGTALEAGEDWPFFRGGLDRCGVVSSAEEEPSDPVRGAINWRWESDRVQILSSPAVVGNRVYVSTVEGLGVFDRIGRGAIQAHDAHTGELIWRFAPRFDSGARDYRATFSSPVVKGDRLVCGEGLHITPRCRVICLDISDEASVRLAWSHETESHVECTPVIGSVRLDGASNDGSEPVAEDRVFVGAGDVGGYLALALSSGEVRWHASGEQFPDAETSLAYHENRVYAGLGNGGRALCVLDAVDGSELARIETPYPVFSPPAIIDGRMYVGMGNGDYVETAAQRGESPAGEVWCVDLREIERSPAAGAFRPQWRLRTSETILGSIAVSEGQAIFATLRGDVMAVDATSGRLAYHWSAREALKSSPCVTGEHVYITTAGGTLYALERRGLAPVWECRLGRGEMHLSSPVIAFGHVYVGADEGGLVCAGEPPPAGEFLWPARLGGAGTAGNLHRAAIPRTGLFGWNCPPTLAGQPAAAFFTAPIAATPERIILPVAVSPGPSWPTGVVCLPALSTSDPPDKPLWKYATDHGVERSPVIAGQSVLLVDGRPQAEGRRLHCVSVEDGSVRWKRAIGESVAGALAADEDSVFLAEEEAAFSRIDLEGERLWKVALGGRIEQPASVTEAMVVLAAAQPARLIALDRQTGALLLEKRLEAECSTSLLVERDTVLFGTRRGIERRRLTDGEMAPEWSIEGGGAANDYACGAGWIAYVTEANELVLVDRRSGRLLREPISQVLPGTVPVAGRDSVLYVDRRHRVRQVLLGGGDSSGGGGAAAKITGWLDDTEALGTPPSSPLVLVGPSVYVGWSGWGLLRLVGEE